MSVIEIEYQQKGVDGQGNEIHYFPKTKGGGGGVVVIEFEATEQQNVFNASKTGNEILSLFEDGKIVVGMVDDLTFVLSGNNHDDDFVAFSNVFTNSLVNKLTTLVCTSLTSNVFVLFSNDLETKKVPSVYDIEDNLTTVNNNLFYDEDGFKMYWNELLIWNNGFADQGFGEIDIYKDIYIFIPQFKKMYKPTIVGESDRYYLMWADNEGNDINTLISRGAQLVYYKK